LADGKTAGLQNRKQIWGIPSRPPTVKLSTLTRPPFQIPAHLTNENRRMRFSLSFSVGTMNAARKTIFFLGVAALLLCVPLTAAAEDDDIQTFPTLNYAITPAAASLSAPGTMRVRGRRAGIAAVACPAPLRYGSEHIANFLLHGGRCHLLSSCLLRC
jgi:hypothetical protein